MDPVKRAFLLLFQTLLSLLRIVPRPRRAYILDRRTHAAMRPARALPHGLLALLAGVLLPAAHAYVQCACPRRLRPAPR
jgi:hypothetical protein